MQDSFDFFNCNGIGSQYSVWAKSEFCENAIFHDVALQCHL